MAVFGHSGCTCAKVVVFGQKRFFSGKVVVFGQKGCIREKVTYFMYNEALMTVVQWKSGCDYYLLSYEHFYLPILPSQMALKKSFLPQQLEYRFVPKATVTSLKVTWIEGPDQAFQGKRISSRNYAAYAT